MFRRIDFAIAAIALTWVLVGVATQGAA